MNKIIKINDINTLQWSSSVDGLLPAVIMKDQTREVLMLGYMNLAALKQTFETGKVTFFSRSKNRLWVKGETSGNHLIVKNVKTDCDSDAILVFADPLGPTCHEGQNSCFEDEAQFYFLPILEGIIQNRFEHQPQGSYVTQLITQGMDRMIQKVGEEAIETVIAAKNENMNEFEGEAADLLFHLMVLLRAKGSSLDQVLKTLEKRHGQKPTRKPS